MSERGNSGRKPPATDNPLIGFTPIKGVPRRPTAPAVKEPAARDNRPPAPPATPKVAAWRPLNVPPPDRATPARVTWGDGSPVVPKAARPPTIPKDFPRTQMARPANPWDRTRQINAREQDANITALERGIKDAQRGLDQIREAFDYKAHDPEAPAGADIDIWSGIYGAKEETLGERLSRWIDTLESRLINDARRYYDLELKLRALVLDLEEYKRTQGLT